MRRLDYASPVDAPRYGPAGRAACAAFACLFSAMAALDVFAMLRFTDFKKFGSNEAFALVWMALGAGVLIGMVIALLKQFRSLTGPR